MKRTNYTKTYNISSRRLSKELKQKQFSAKTFESRFKLSFKDNAQDITGYGRIRIQKDSIIWGSINALGIPIVKFKITPTKVQYYNKLNSEYYDGDFKLISRQLGVDLSFDNIQNLLLGDIILPINPKQYRLSIEKKYYQLDQNGQVLSSIKITPFFKVLSEMMQHQEGKLAVNYFEYQKVGKQDVPKKIKIETQETPNNATIIFEYRSPTVGKTLRFPFKIPSGYTPVVLH